jgi:hypothetical protein
LFANGEGKEGDGEAGGGGGGGVPFVGASRVEDAGGDDAVATGGWDAARLKQELSRLSARVGALTADASRLRL